jgi:hypothetical protein
MYYKPIRSVCIFGICGYLLHGYKGALISVLTFFFLDLITDILPIHKS